MNILQIFYNFIFVLRTENCMVPISCRNRYQFCAQCKIYGKICGLHGVIFYNISQPQEFRMLFNAVVMRILFRILSIWLLLPAMFDCMANSANLTNVDSKLVETMSINSLQKTRERLRKLSAKKTGKKT
jgi:hypothetical protein